MQLVFEGLEFDEAAALIKFAKDYKNNKGDNVVDPPYELLPDEVETVQTEPVKKAEKVEAPKVDEKKEETKAEKVYTVDMVRKLFADNAMKGGKEQNLAILAKYGLNKVSEATDEQLQQLAGEFA